MNCVAICTTQQAHRCSGELQVPSVAGGPLVHVLRLRRRARARAPPPPRTGRLESVAQPHSRMKSPRQDPLGFCLSISSTHQRFSDFLRDSQIFSREKTVAPARKNTNAATHKNTSACTQKTPMPAPKNPNAATTKTPMPTPKNTNACNQKPQCHDHKNTIHQCLRAKTPMPRPQKHQCLRAKTPLPAPPMWPRPSAYTREFPKLTCVGIGPRPRRVCRQWGFQVQV